jgi:hypothetical protein
MDIKKGFSKPPLSQKEREKLEKYRSTSRAMILAKNSYFLTP